MPEGREATLERVQGRDGSATEAAAAVVVALLRETEQVEEEKRLLLLLREGRSSFSGEPECLPATAAAISNRAVVGVGGASDRGLAAVLLPAGAHTVGARRRCTPALAEV